MTQPITFDSILQQLAPVRAGLLGHPLYQHLDTIGGLRTFMEHHVFAVWDFMSLLKSLQQKLCPVGVPWLPPSDPLTARFINEIVLGEESDADGSGSYASHFELYRRAMQQCGADTTSIDRFVECCRNGVAVDVAFNAAEAPAAVRPFVRQTFDFINSGDICTIASAFTFGREDLLPDVFQRIVDTLSHTHSGLAEFKYYLDRHIELDGGEHGPLAKRLMESLCGKDEEKWLRARTAAVRSLEARRELWGGMLAAIAGPVAAAAI